MFLSSYKSSLKKNYINQEFFIEDSTPNSPSYFDVTFFPDYIGGGKSVIKIKGNGLGLKQGSQIDAEVLDADGNVIYSEFPDFVDKYNNIYLSMYVYDYAVKGLGTLTLVGQAEYDPDGDQIPESEQDGFNVKWTRDILILPDIRNNAIIDFAQGPTITAAQITGPFRVTTAYTSSQILEVTSSLINYVTTYNKGYDFDFSTTEDVLDEYLNDILINPAERSRTANIVAPNTRQKDYDITAGYKLIENTRFNTYIYTTQSFFRKEMTGGQFSFLSTPSSSYPQTASNTTIVNTLTDQLSTYGGNIVKVVDQYRALIDLPVVVSMSISDSTNNTYSSHIYSDLKNFTSSISYRPTDSTFITSSISQSYVEFTFDNVNPIVGQVYRIKTFYKTSGQTGDYKLLNDQYVKNLEVLVDPSRPNQTSYAKQEGPYYLIGHFTDPSKLTYTGLFDDLDWNAFKEYPTYINQWTAVTASDYLADAVVLSASYANSETYLFTPSAWQAYSINKIYTLTFNCTLEADMELELYGNSQEIGTETQDTSGVTRAFLATTNQEKTRYSDNFCRFGKYIGSIKNSSKTTKGYSRVAFDFEADASGIGRPLFRLKPSSNGNTKGYISEVSVKPQLLQGFTPGLIQYPIPINDTDFQQSLSQSVDFKFEYYDFTGNQSEFVSYIKDAVINLKTELPTLGCQSERYQHGFSGVYRRSSNDSVINQLGISTANGAPTGDLTGSTGTAYYAGPTIFQIQQNQITLDNYYWNTQYSQRSTFGSFGAPIAVDNTAASVTWKITSSWQIFDEQILNIAATYNINYPTLTSTSSLDDRYFVYGPSCCINKGDTNIQWTIFTQSGAFRPINSTKITETTEALRKTRLLWPHTKPIESQSSNASLKNYFTENGGVYRVSFKVKHYNKASSTWYNADSGSKLNVFIHNVNADNTSTTNPYGGTPGQYPPLQNITTFTFNANTQWIDAFTGYKYVQLSTTLVQYGFPAQLVFEASGSKFASNEWSLGPDGTWNYSGGDAKAVSPNAFGGCIDDIQICKIGVSTDPYYIKPTTPGGFPTIDRN